MAWVGMVDSPTRMVTGIATGWDTTPDSTTDYGPAVTTHILEATTYTTVLTVIHTDMDIWDQVAARWVAEQLHAM